MSPSIIASLGLTLYMEMLFVGRMLAHKLSELWTDKKTLKVFYNYSGWIFISMAINKSIICNYRFLFGWSRNSPYSTNYV